jgi:hypothetical protein
MEERKNGRGNKGDKGNGKQRKLETKETGKRKPRRRRTKEAEAGRTLSLGEDLGVLVENQGSSKWNL